LPPAATTSAQALGNLQSFEGSQPSASTVASQNATQFGVPAEQQQVSGLRGAIQNTTNLLSQVAPSVMGNTQNSLVTQAQANSQISNAEAPIQTDLTNENNQYNQDNSDLTNSENSANALTTADLTGQQNQMSYLQSIYSDLANQQQQTFANNLAEQNLAASEAASADSASSDSVSPTLGTSGTSATSGTGRATVGKMATNSVGGYEFTNASGQGETMAAYLIANGATPANIVSQVKTLLQKSGAAGDKQIYNAISSGKYTPAQLEQIYPQIFGVPSSSGSGISTTLGTPRSVPSVAGFPQV